MSAICRIQKGATVCRKFPPVPATACAINPRNSSGVYARRMDWRQLRVEKRYVWRLASALKWGFADFDNLGVDADRQTLSPEDFAKVMDLLTFRPMQFCMFLKALVGAEEMQRLMVEAIKVARKV